MSDSTEKETMNDNINENKIENEAMNDNDNENEIIISKEEAQLQLMILKDKHEQMAELFSKHCEEMVVSIKNSEEMRRSVRDIDLERIGSKAKDVSICLNRLLNYIEVYEQDIFEVFDFENEDLDDI